MATAENQGSFTHFYRFRPVDSLLGEKYRELERQQIYFASQDQLNDPLEGHVNIYWQGDAILWRNLFKNYIHSALFCFNLWNISEELGRVLSWEDIPARNPLAAGIFPDHHELESIFFGDATVIDFVDRIANSNRRIGRNELTAHLRTVHYFVLLKINEMYRKRREADGEIIPPIKSEYLESESERIKSGSNIFDIVEKTIGDKSQMREAHYIDIVNGYDGADLHNYYSAALNLSDRNRIFMSNDFSQAYVRRLGTLMYPSWYAACFMENCAASSMWAYYGESHFGVCLKFRAKNGEGSPFLRMNSVCGYNADGKIWSPREHFFESVDYHATHQSLNFFENMGTIPHPICNSQWYTNKGGEISALLLRTEAERDLWRSKYWDAYNKINKTKTKTWQGEHERRLILYSNLGELDAEDRTLKYDFSALEGIIFGVRTPATVKVQIIKLIRDKCVKYERSDFKFYQASFSNNQDEMTFSEIDAVSGPHLFS